MSTVEGRYWDVIETVDGRLIFAHRFADWFGDVPVRQYQIEQYSRTRTVIRIVPDEGYREEFGRSIADRARTVLGADVEIRVVDAISDYRSGKRRVVKSKVRFPAAV
jgi:hypothetical protein